MCCLNYENDYYKEVRSRLPKIGTQVETEHGRGTIIEVNVPKESVIVRLLEAAGQLELPAGSVKRSKRRYKGRAHTMCPAVSPGISCWDLGSCHPSFFT